jgi:two-component system sensor histidine kinase AlgZ
MQRLPAMLNRLGFYLAVWLPIGGSLTALFVLVAGSPLAEAVALTLPLVTAHALLSVGVGYSCRALPLSGGRLERVFLTHLAVAVLSSTLWVGLSQAAATMYERMNLFPGVKERLIQQAGLLFTLGLMLYLLAAAVHYLLIAAAASREAEKRVLEADLAAKEAELSALRAQIDPHFLFNSLNSINALVDRDPVGARQVCAELGDLLRTSIQAGRLTSVPFEDELSMVQRYLAIEKIRLGDRLDVDQQVDEESRRFPVPPLLLQPLIENALKHGIGSLIEGGTVHMSARVQGAHLRLIVDNPVDRDASPQPGMGTGLNNLRKRLLGAYGDAAVLRTGHTGDRYRVEVLLPPGRQKVQHEDV